MRALKKELSEILNVDLECYKPLSLERQLRRAETYLAETARGKRDTTEIVSRVFIGVSGFFRDPQEFDLLRRLIIPVLVQKPDPHILSLGCADGSELYSVAMLLVQHDALMKSVLLGLDCNPRILDVARNRVLTQKDKDQLPHGCQTAFLESHGPQQWTIVSFIRQHVQFEFANVLDHPLSEDWDLILCRNLLIYLQPAAQTRLIENCRAGLKPNGVLMLGRAERIIRPQTLGWDSLSSHLYRKRPILRSGQ